MPWVVASFWPDKSARFSLRIGARKPIWSGKKGPMRVIPATFLYSGGFRAGAQNLTGSYEIPATRDSRRAVIPIKPRGP